VLVAVRALVLVALVTFLFRPIAVLPPASTRDAIVPVLVDVSRSMRLNDADGQTRLARAAALLRGEFGTALSSHFTTEMYSVGEATPPVKADALSADGGRTDLTGAIAAIRERYRGQRVAGVVLLSDGGDTEGGEAGGPGRAGGAGGAAGGDLGGPPVFAVGIGSPDGPRDR